MVFGGWKDEPVGGDKLWKELPRWCQTSIKRYEDSG